MIIARDKLKKEIQYSAIFTQDFKTYLLQMIYEAYAEGRDDGLKEAKGETIDQMIKRKEKLMKEIG